MSADRDIPAITHYTTEAPVVCFDFSKFPELLSGGSMSNPVMTPVTGITFTGTAVLTVPFYEGDSTAAPAVAVGKGVSTKVLCTVPGTYVLACTVDMSITVNGQTLTSPRTQKLNLTIA
jgi:hypothetical protein